MNLNLVDAMNRFLYGSLLVALSLTASAPAHAQSRETRERATIGLLVMAHGGTAGWDASIVEAAQPVTSEVPTAIAFGMADPATLSHALDSLRAEGVEQVVVVRMFLSGASFIDQTEYLLGLDPTPPAFFPPAHGASGGGHGGGHAVAAVGPPQPIAHGLEVATHLDGMVDSEEARIVFAERALALSRDPASESVLLIAHGMGDPQENGDLLAAMAEIEREVAKTSFHTVRSATLREDWAEARIVAEQEIRAFVEGENEAGRRVLVVPVRLSGTGPYAEVLTGLDYDMGEALLPHAEVTDWLRHTADRIARESGWSTPFASLALVNQRDGPF